MRHIRSTRLWMPCLMFILSSCTRAEKQAPKTYTVEISQMQFQPSELTVQKGDTVVWVNNDLVTHDVTEATRKAWASGPLPAGQSWRLPVTNSADYYCSIHVVMKGKIVVQ
jgi:plastocyanin